MNALLARLLAPSELGVYFIVAGAIAGGMPLITLGQGLAAVRRVSVHLAHGEEALARGAAASSLRIAAAGAAIAGVTAAALIVSAPSTWSLPLPAAIAVVIWMMTTSLTTVMVELLRANHRIGAATAFGGAVAQTALLLVLVIAIAAAVRVSLLASLWATAAAQALSLLAAWALLMPWFCGPSSFGGPSLLREGLPLAGYGVFAFLLGQVDLWVVGRCIGADAAALYGAAVRLVALVTMPLALMNAVLPPMIGRYHARRERRRLESLLRDSATVSAAPAASGLAMLLICGGPLLGLFYGPAFRPAAGILCWLSIGQLINVACGSCGFTLAMTGHQRTLAWITAVAAAALLVSAALIAPVFGATGVAACTALAIAGWNISAMVAVRRLEGVWTLVRFNGWLAVWSRLRERHPDQTEADGR